MTLHHDCTVLIETDETDETIVTEKVTKKRVQYWGGENEEESPMAPMASLPEILPVTEEPTKADADANLDANLDANVDANVDANLDDKLESASVTAPPEDERQIEARPPTPVSPPATPVGSVVSRAMTALTQVNQLRKPRVRTIVLGPSNDDDMQSRFTSSSRRK
jgi:hypothetical protein